MAFEIQNVNESYKQGFTSVDVHYCGRGWNSSAGRIESALGNPYSVKPNSVAGSTLPAYKAWLWAKMQGGDELVLAELWDIVDDIVAHGTAQLGCHCRNKSTCHCNIVGAAAEYMLANPDMHR